MYSAFPEYAQVMLDNFELQPAPNVERTEFDDGFIGQAPRNSLTRYELQLTYRLSSAGHKIAFETWRRETLRDGALHFAWVQPTHPADPDFAVPRRARIVGGKVTYKPLTDRFDDWSASMTLEFWR